MWFGKDKMDTPHPPYNVVQPRVLDRWLDVNSQNGPLQRFQYYFDIPTFNVSKIFYQVADLVIDFWYQAPNNFSLILPVFPIINSLLCIAWVDDNGNVRRYKLNTNPDVIMPEDVPQYTDQLIMKNFRIEVWNTNEPPTILEEPIRIYTTVRGNRDYRYSDDKPIASVSVTDNNFYSPNNGEYPPTMNLPLTFPNTIITN